jgi:peptide/nickel transport system permease protein
MSLVDRLKPPGWQAGGKLYLLGTDGLGRDVLSRMLYGARVSLTIAAAALLVGGTFGLAIGVISGYLGGLVDAVLMRLTDCFLALPTLLVALVFVMTMGGGLQTVVIAISIFIWAQFARVIRSEVLSLKERGYVALARVAGCSNTRIMLVHILPNVVNTFVVLCSLQVSGCVLTEATLSFLGAGVPQPTPTWGNMVADGRDFITTAWWIGAFPGIALTLVVLSFNTFGDWLRDLLDPKLAQL